jgi:hypothetical protein
LKGLVQIATGISTRRRIRRSEEIRAAVLDPFYAAKAAAGAAAGAAKTVSFLLFTVTFHANPAHNLTRSPSHL